MTVSNTELVDVLWLESEEEGSHSELGLFVDRVGGHLLCSVVEQVRQVGHLLLLLLVEHHL